MVQAISPLAPAHTPDLPPIDGVSFATAAAGIKYKNRTDVLLAAFTPGTVVAGVLTRSKCPSAAVDWCRAGLSGGEARALVVNSGNANAFTGMKGKTAVELTAKLAAEAINCAPHEVFIASTGVIGEPLDGEKFRGVLSNCAGRLKASAGLAPAEAIMTTDTFPKVAVDSFKSDGIEVKIAGIAKGAGMIEPDMATMLSFIFTDMPVSAGILQGLLSTHIKTSFNAITVDSDTSTSDTVLVFATGRAALNGVVPLTSWDDPRVEGFGAALHKVLFDLAMQVVRDGEGATKFVTVRVQGADDDDSAARIAKSIANSPLVKTAIAGEDANWGRIVMAVGKAGEPADRDKIDIWFGDIQVAENGERTRGYDEEAASIYMKNAEISIKVDIGVGEGTAAVYTCDLTHGYISINADYRS